ncbi:MAG: hypothetical protein RIN55_06295 [Tissierellaceae bacterium]|nr:hypothetical protein [Tissierellaceae bacterium]
MDIFNSFLFILAVIKVFAGLGDLIGYTITGFILSVCDLAFKKPQSNNKYIFRVSRDRAYIRNFGGVNMFTDVEMKIKRKNKILFSRESQCLQDLIELIQLQKHRTLVMWALDCAKLPLMQFEAKYPVECRPRRCLELSEDWARGKIKMPIAKRAILDSHAVVKEINDAEYGALCHAIGHAGATVHVETHALGLPMYELTALVLKYGKDNFQAPVKEKITYYNDRLLYWQQNTDELRLNWADFLLDDTKPNKERLLSEKRKLKPKLR